MNQFHIIVMSIACVILILTLTLLGVKMSMSGNSTVTFPPSQNNCPDKWNAQGNIADNTFACIAPIMSTDPNYLEFTSENLPKGYSGKCTGDADDVEPSLGKACTDADGPLKNITFNPMSKDWLSDGKSDICAKKEWANKHNVAWDGYSNYNKC